MTAKRSKLGMATLNSKEREAAAVFRDGLSRLLAAHAHVGVGAPPPRRTRKPTAIHG